MPSSHAAGATAMAISSGLELGFSSPIFAPAFVFAMVTMFDAQGVRRAAGEQAKILNKVIDDMYWQGKIGSGQLKELLGHTPVQVLIGSIIGALIALVLKADKPEGKGGASESRSQKQEGQWCGFR